MKPKEPSPKSLSGLELMEQNRFEEALQLFREEIQNNSSYLAYYGFATSLYTIHQSRGTTTKEVLEEALKNYELSLDENPDYPSANMLIGILYKHKIGFIVQQEENAYFLPDLRKQILELINKSKRHLIKAASLDSKLKATVAEELAKAEELKFFLSP